MKVLIATFTFSPNKDGVSEAASAMASAFLKKDWQVEIATDPTNPARNDPQQGYLPIHEFSITANSTRFRTFFSGDVEKYQQFLLNGVWDIIIFHTYAWPISLAVPIMDLISAKTILVSHGYGSLIWVPVAKFPFGLGALFRSATNSLLMLRWIKKIDHLVVLSERRDLLAFYDHTLAHLVRHKGIKVIPNGVDLKETPKDPLRFRHKIGADEKTIIFLCVANYSRRKDQGFAARAFRRAAIPSSVLIFIGSDFNEYTEIFMREDSVHAQRNTPGRIIWMEKQNRETTVNALGGSDVFVLSASHEAQPFALLEAMREGKPWIARDAGCISELPGGLVVHSESSMAETMQILAQDANQRRRLGAEGRNAVENTYNRETYVQSYCELIEDLVDSKPQKNI